MRRRIRALVSSKADLFVRARECYVII